MDLLLTKVTGHAMNYAIRSGIAITTSYAIDQCGRLLKQAPRGKEHEELMRLQLRLEAKIRIISPAIDMIELISARGNSCLESALNLTKEVRQDIQKLGTSLSEAANDEESLRRKSSRAKSREQNEQTLRSIICAMKALLMRIEDAVPLMNLAITTSGVNLSTKLSGTISPSRLLQASTFLTAADRQYTTSPGSRCQVGPTYTLSLYMLFAGHALRPLDEDGVHEMTWKEVIHKARVKLVRLPLNDLYSLPGESSPKNSDHHNTMPAEALTAEFAYQVLIVEDLDDGRAHTFEDGDSQPGPFDGVMNAGIRDVIPVHEVSKVFYADTGKILNIGGDSDETNNPVLLLKRNVHAEPPRRMMRQSEMGELNTEHQADDEENDLDEPNEAEELSEIDAQFYRESAPNTPQLKQRGSSHLWRLPADLDPEWMALEVFVEDPESDSDPDEQASRPTSSDDTSDPPADSSGVSLTSALSRLNFNSTPSSSPARNRQLVPGQSPFAGLNLSPNKRPAPAIKTSLSLLEMILKLTALQQFRQESHLAIEDELLNFFLEDSATAGAGPDKEYRQRLRHDAIRRVGFDPYDESPIKRRSEQYLNHARGAVSPRPEFDAEAFGNQYLHDGVPGYYHESSPRELLHFRQESKDHAAHFRSSPPSSPSPRPSLNHQQTPARSPPARAYSSEKHRTAVQAKFAGKTTSPLNNRNPSPSGAAKSRQAILRSQTEPKPRSPLGQAIVTSEKDGNQD